MEKAKQTILIIDDEQSIIDMLSEYLSQEGFHVVGAKSGGEGLDRFKDEKADLVLLDKNLPDMSFDKIAKGIWENDPYTPVVIITAYPSRESLKEALDMGVSHYLEKPFELDRAMNVIERALHQSELLREGEGKH